MRQNTEALVTFKEVGFRYAENLPWIIRKANFSISRGEILCIVGANGSGKTTLAKLLVGELKPIEGSIYRKSDLESGIRYQLYEKNLLPWYSAEHNLSIISEDGSFKQNFKQWLQVAGFDIWHKQKVYTLSGGQKQILSVINTLLLDFEFIVLDEPFSAIDPGRVTEFWKLLRHWTKKTKTCLTVITHNLDEAIAVGDKIMILVDPPSGEYETYNLERSENQSDFLISDYAQNLRKKMLDVFYRLQQKRK